MPDATPTPTIEQKIRIEDDALKQLIIGYLEGYLTRPCSNELKKTVKQAIRLFGGTRNGHTSGSIKEVTK
jgi:hypothetical protein